jgi:topoisomerase-4 subunit A
MAFLDKLYDSNFLEYASYVVKDRAIPHVDDGLKPVQRRILHSLFELDDGKFHKVANVVGNTMKYHPHGDASIYSALVVVANKEMFIDKQGNFGNIYTGDVASAARYIECRATALAKSTLYNPDLTEYVDSYDGRNKEPVVFPAKLPVLLAQGAEGIAVGMATKILPHNLIELLQAQIAYMEDREFTILPDFLTGGLADVSEYSDGNGKVLVRAKLDTSDPKRILVTEIPYGTSTESLITSIEDAARKGRVKVGSISDFTAEKVEIEIKLQRGVYAEEVIDALYAFTDCEVSLSANLMVIHEDKPRLMSASDVLRHNVDRLVDILKGELRHEEAQLLDRRHAKTLEQIFIENRIYKEIEDKKTVPAVAKAVSDGLKPHQKAIGRPVTPDDVETLLRIPIRRISLYDIEKAKNEMREIEHRLSEITLHLGSIIPYSINFLNDLIETYGKQFPRRTEIVSFKKVDVREAARRDLKLCYDKNSGYLGFNVQGQLQTEVSAFDRVLVIRKDGTYSVVDAPDKLFVGGGMLYCGFIDKELIFNVLYKDAKGIAFIKRTRIDKFILNRSYDLVPEGGTLLRLTTDSERKVALDYKPKPRLRVLQEEFDIGGFPVRGLKASGIRLSPRELKTCRLI